MITMIVTDLVLVYKSFYNTVCIYGHANKASRYCLLPYVQTLQSVFDF